jgi:dienelactone hydrolase
MSATQIEIRTADGACPAYVYGDRSAPSVLVYIDGIGMRPAMQAIAERVAAGGYHVLVLPDGCVYGARREETRLRSLLHRRLDLASHPDWQGLYQS